MSVPPPRVVRDDRVEWTRLLENALQPVRGALPLNPTVKATLTMLQSYAESPLEIFADASTGVSDTNAYAALLLALDKAITGWPHALQQRLVLPTVHMSRVRERNLMRYYAPTRPRAEAVLVCYNAAVANMEAGLASMDRVRAEAAAGGYGATRLPASTGTAAKTAYKAFQRAEALLRLGEDVLVAQAGAVGKRASRDNDSELLPLSVTARQDVSTLIDIAAARPVTRLCVAVAKYLFSLASATTSERPDLLARVAYSAACVELPTSCGDLSVLPTLLLAAYHRHMAEYYYASGRQKAGTPDMSHALGHARYADQLIRDVSTIYAGPVPASSGVRAGLTRWKNALLSSVSTRLAFGQGSEGHQSGAGGGDSGSALLPIPPSPTPEELSHEDDEDRAQREARETTVAAYNRLLKAVDERGEEDVLRVFPIVHRLLHQVNQLIRKYEQENRVVYFATVSSVDTVRDDVPGHQDSDTALDGREDAETELSRRAEAVRGLVSQLPASTTFASLPSADLLEKELTRATAAAKDAEALAAAVDHLDTVLREMEATGMHPSPEVASAIEAIAPCFASEEGGVPEALQMAEDAVRQAWERQVRAEQLWRDRKNAHLGAECGRHATTIEHEALAKEFHGRLITAQQGWRSELERRFGRPIESEENLLACLMPARSHAQEAVAKARAVRDEACEAMSALIAGDVPTTASASTALLREVMACAKDGEALAQSWAAAHNSNAAALKAVHDVVRVVWDAPLLVQSLNEMTRALETEADRVGEVQPLERFADGAVQFAKRTTDKRSSSTAAKKPKAVVPAATSRAAQKRARTSSPTVPSRSSSSSSAHAQSGTDEDDVSSADFGTPLEASLREEPTTAKVNAALLSKIKARRGGTGVASVEAPVPVSARKKPASPKRAAPAARKKSAKKK